MQDFLHGVYMFLLWVIPAAVIMFTLRKFMNIPDELFRKILHTVLLIAYFPFLYGFRTWWMAAGFALLLAVVVYPILALLDRIPAFSSFVNERKHGEFKSSLVLAMSMAAVCISVCWGILGEKLLVLACVYAWGVGDAFAALIGKRFGKHKIRLPFADRRKSWEGSGAMFLSSVLSVLIILMVRGGLDFDACLLIALVAALVTTYVELCPRVVWIPLPVPRQRWR